MASTFTTNLNLELQGTGDNAGTWGSVLNLAALTIIDQVLGGVQSFSLSNVNVNVSTSQSQNNAFILSGTLTGNVQITWPAIGRTIFVANNTTGNFTVTLARSGGGSTVVLQSGRNGFFVLTSAGVIAQTTNDVVAGTIVMFGSATPPTGYLACNGAAVSRSTYATLFGVIGTTFGSGNGSTTFNLPDFRGYFPRGWNDNGSVDPARVFGSVQASANLQHTHTGSAASHSHLVRASGSSRRGLNGGNVGTNWYGSSGDSVDGGTAQRTSDPSGNLNVTLDQSGGTESRPVNLAVLFMIKT